MSFGENYFAGLQALLDFQIGKDIMQNSAFFALNLSARSEVRTSL